MEDRQSVGVAESLLDPLVADGGQHAEEVPHAYLDGCVTATILVAVMAMVVVVLTCRCIQGGCCHGDDDDTLLWLLKG